MISARKVLLPHISHTSPLKIPKRQCNWHRFRGRLKVLITVLNHFRGVDDVYILERLFAIACGCALQSKDSNQLGELAQLTFEMVLDCEYPIPDMLLRDCARGVVEVANARGCSLGFDLQKVRTPTIAALGYIFALLKDKELILSCVAKYSVILSLLSLAIAAICGMWCTINRLRDVQGTARRIRETEGAPSSRELRVMGKRTWKLSYTQLVTSHWE